MKRRLIPAFFILRRAKRGITSFWHDHCGADLFGTAYFVAGPFRHRSFCHQFGALWPWQFSYLGLGFKLWFGLVKKHQIGAEMVAPKSCGPAKRCLVSTFFVENQCLAWHRKQQVFGTRRRRQQVRRHDDLFWRSPCKPQNILGLWCDDFFFWGGPAFFGN